MNDLSLHVIDIIQNSLSAGASLIKLSVEEDLKRDLLTISIGDNGRGMSQEQVSKLEDPFFYLQNNPEGGDGDSAF